MSISSIKKILLAGTAIVAAATFSTQAQAVTATSADQIWGESATQGGTTVPTAASGDSLNLAGYTTIVTNNGTANDVGAGGTNTFTLGAVTDTTGVGSAGELAISTGGNGSPLTVTIGSFVDGVSTSPSSLLVQTGNTESATVTVTGTLSTTGGLYVENAGIAASNVGVTLESTSAVNGLTTITADSLAAAANATLTLTGNGTSNFTGGVALQGTATDIAGLTISGALAQTVDGNIYSNGFTNGVLTSDNNGGLVTFNGSVGADGTLASVVLQGTGGTTFASTVNADTISIENATGTDTFTGAVTAGAGNFVYTAAGTAILTGGLTGNVDFASNLGTVQLGGGGTITGTVDSTGGTGGGTLTLNGAGTVEGNVGGSNALTQVYTGAGTDLFEGTVNAATVTVNGTGTTTFDGLVTAEGGAGNLNFSSTGTAILSGGLTGNVDFASNLGTVQLGGGKTITGAVDSTGLTGGGTLTLNGAGTVDGNVGATKALTLVNTGAGTDLFEGTVNAATVTVNGTGTTTFDGLVTAEGGAGNLNFSSTGTAILDAGLTGNVDFAGHAGTVQLVDGQTISGVINNSSGTAGKGTLELLGNSTIAGQVGGTSSLALVKLDGGGANSSSAFTSVLGVNAEEVEVAGTDSTSFTGLVTGNVDFTAAGSVTLGAGLTGNVDFASNLGTVNVASGFGITGTVDSTGGSGGTLNLEGGTQSVGGNVGATNALTLVEAGQAGGATTFGGTVDAATISVGTGSVTFNGDVGTLGAVSVDLGSNNGTVNVGGFDTLTTSALNGSVDNVTGSGTGGTLNLLGGGTQTVTGEVGATGELAVVSAAPLVTDVSNFGSTVNSTLVNVGAGTANFTGAVTGTTLTVAVGTAALGDATNVITTTNLTGGGTVTLAGGGTLQGAVTSGTSNTGTLSLLGNGTVTGAVGTGNALLLVNTGAGTDAFNSTVNADGVKVNGTGTTTFTGAVTTGANNFTFSSTGTAILTGGLVGNVDFLDENGTVEVGTGKTISGTVKSTGGVNGTLDLLGTSTIANTVSGLSLVEAGVANSSSSFTNAGGLSTATLAVGTGAVTVTGDLVATNIAVGGAAGGTLALNGSENSGNLLFNALSTGTVTLASGSTFTGSMGGVGGTAAAGIGNVVFSGASSDITTIGATGILKSLTLDNPVAGTPVIVAATGAVLAAQTDNLGINALTTTSTFGIGTGGIQTLNSTINSATVYGHVTAMGAATVNTDTVVDVTVSPSLVKDATYNIVTGTGGTGVAVLTAGDLKVTNSATLVTKADTAVGTTSFNVGMMDYKQVDAGGPNLEIQATIDPTMTGNDLAVGKALSAFEAHYPYVPATTAETQLNAVATILGEATTAAQAHTELQSLTPTVDGGTEVTVLTIGQEIQEIADGRLQILGEGGDATSGVAAGATSHGYSMWFEGYGQQASQSAMDSVNGYDATTWGGAVGADSTAMFDNAIVGVALNYGQATINSSNANTTSTDLDNYGIDLYGSYDLGNRVALEGQAGFAYNTITSDRHNANLAGATAVGDTNSDQYSAKLALGRAFPIASASNNLTLTPNVSAAYTYLNTAGYTETGAGGADNTVGSSSQSVLDLGIGATAAWKIMDNDGNTVKPSLHAAYAYDAIGDAVQTTSSFVGDPAANTFTTTGASPARNIFDVGAKLVYATKANWDFSANYDLQLKQDYTSSTEELRATAHF